MTELRYGFPDDQVDVDLLAPCISLARYGWSAWRSGDQVLVRCQQGVNRSGLVTALILMIDGMTAPDVIALLREQRGGAVLSNASFSSWLIERAPAQLDPTATGSPERGAP